MTSGWSALRHAQVWMPGDIASMDIRVGPAGRQRLPARGRGQLRLRRREADRHAEVRLRHFAGRQDSREVRRGERRSVLRSRGDAAAVGARVRRRPRVSGQGRLQRMPGRSDQEPRRKSKARATFASAVVERKLAGDEIELRKDSGWAWVELNFVDQTSGGAPLAHRDALKLLAALIQHTDTKPQQQRLVCLDKVQGLTPQEDGSCAHPFMMINDLGKTFGQATVQQRRQEERRELRSVVEHADVEGCEGVRRPALEVVSPARSSTRRSARPAASSSRTCCRSSPISSCAICSRSRGSRSAIRRSTVDDWVGAFKQKRDEIANASCANPVL